MRFLIDACRGYTVAEELRVQGHDVIVIAQPEKIRVRRY